MDVSSHIKELLHYHNCVIVPGFGGFVANYQSASFDADSGVFYPPSKKVVFNTNLRNNDGLLLNQIVQHEGMTFDEASVEVSSFLDATERRLKEFNIVQLPGLGKFYYDMEHNLQFLPDRNANFHSDAYGLTEIQTIKIAPVKKQPAVTETETEVDHLKVVHAKPGLVNKPEKVKPRAKERRIRVLKPGVMRGMNAYVAVMIILAGSLVFQWFWFDNTVEDVKMHFSDITSPFFYKVQELKKSLFKNKDLKEEMTINEEVNNDPEKLDEEISVDDSVDETVIDHLLDDVQDEIIEEQVIVEPVIYVIVGSFQKRRNAVILQNKVINKNIECSILAASNGNFRVGIGFDANSKAYNYLDEARKLFDEEAWIWK